MLGRVWILVASVMLACAAQAQSLPASCSSVPADTNRLALVIGNNAYTNDVGRLTNAVPDARRIADALCLSNFKVILRSDLDQAGTDAAVDAFSARLRQTQGAIGFFYYAGHGVSAEVYGTRENFLVPVNETIATKDQLLRRAVRLNNLIDGLAATGARALFVVSDACRDNFGYTFDRSTKSRSYAVVSTRPNVLVAYATAEGSTTPDDGAFAQELASQLTRPGQDAGLAFFRASQRIATKRKWGQNAYISPGGIPEDICFQSCKVSEDERDWQRLSGRGEVGLRAYLSLYPSGRYAAEARRQLASIAPRPDPTPEPDPYVPPRPDPTPEPVESGVDRAMRAAREGRSVSEREFRDTLTGGGEGPDMVVVPAGRFVMGSPDNEEGRWASEGPVRTVSISNAFAVGKYEVTWAEWERCVSAGGCDNAGPVGKGGDEGWGKGNRPVINVSWNDAQAYVSWLSRETGEDYRLLSEAEWEYAARAGTTTAYWWGNTASHEYANYGNDTCCSGLASGRDQWVNTSPVGSFRPNSFGLYDMHGNVWEWVEDCWNASYSGAPTDGRARTTADCSSRANRGGSWVNNPRLLRSANRGRSTSTIRYDDLGFRVARTLP